MTEEVTSEDYEHEEHGHLESYSPFMVTLGVSVLFIGLALATGNLGIGFPVAGVGLLILLGGVGNWLKEQLYGPWHAPEEPHGEPGMFEGYSRWTLGFWIFLVGEIIMFGMILGSWMFVRFNFASIEWDSGLFSVQSGAIMTYILIVSGVTYFYGTSQLKKGNTSGFLAGTGLTALLGITFLGIKVNGWMHHWHEGLTISQGIEGLHAVVGSFYYFVTGLHALHVTIGILGMLYYVVGGVQGLIDEGNYETASLLGQYWYFVDVVWLFVFPLFYLT